MEGFLNIKMRPWLRSALTRSIALIPAVIVIVFMGSKGTYKLLILSQVILSLQLPFAVIPLIHFTSYRKKMGAFSSAVWIQALAWIVASIIFALNLMLVVQEMKNWPAGGSILLLVFVITGIVILLGTLIYITFGPLSGARRVWESGIITAGRNIAQRIKPLTIKQIGAALEHSNVDAKAISAAISMARSQKARLTLIHVVETPGSMVYGKDAQSLHSREDQACLEKLAREIEERDFPVETLLLYGNPIAEIVKSVGEMNFDLLVLGYHGHRGVEDVIFGQTVDSVRHAVKIPVLIVRAENRPSERQ